MSAISAGDDLVELTHAGRRVRVGREDVEQRPPPGTVRVRAAARPVAGPAHRAVVPDLADDLGRLGAGAAGEGGREPADRGVPAADPVLLPPRTRAGAADQAELAVEPGALGGIHQVLAQ